MVYLLQLSQILDCLSPADRGAGLNGRASRNCEKEKGRMFITSPVVQIALGVPLAVGTSVGLVTLWYRKPAWEPRVWRDGGKFLQRVSSQERQARALQRIGKLFMVAGLIWFIVEAVRKAL
jgi:hypothetical protein